MVFGHFFHRLRSGLGSRLGPRTATHPLILTTTVLKFFAAAHLTWMYAFCISPATGPSMMPTFSAVGDWFFISRYHRRGRNIRVGDVVCYRIPVFDDARGLKRVLGMPGDYVMLTTPGVEGSEGRELMIQVCLSLPLFSLFCVGLSISH